MDEGAWHKNIGSFHLSEDDELLALRRLFHRKPNVARRLFYLSKCWKFLRKRVLARDGYRCVRCGSVHTLHVDHIKYPEIIGDEGVEWLQTLCFSCHQDKTKKHTLHNEHYKIKVKVSNILFNNFRRRNYG